MASDPPCPASFEGGEHTVFIPSPQESVIKHTLPGYYGRILEERSLLDPRTFTNKRKLAMRGALPSEYLKRWAIMADIFGLVTTYVGQMPHKSGEPQMSITQPFIVEAEDDPATLEDVAQLMEAHGFQRVSGDLIVNPEIQEVTWYRQRDGVLITDAHARNLRKDMTGLIIPIDLVIGIVTREDTTLLPAPDSPWQPTL